jgi:ATP synthase protein I
MAKDTHDKAGRTGQGADEAALSARLRSLGAQLSRIGKSRPVETQTGGTSGSDPSAIARGFRLSAELVGGVIVGAMIGWLLDYGLGISPWGLIVFLLLGFAAGVLNVMRAAGVVPGNNLPGNDADRK